MTDARARPGIAIHYLRYLGTNALVVAAGFVSFPLMARLLDNAQFGLLGFYEAWALLLAAVLKLGAQHAILRFFPHGGDRAARARFRLEQIRLPFALALLLWAALMAGAWLLAPRLPAQERPLLLLMLLGLPLTVWASLVEAVMYALERSDISLWLKSLWRWSELLLVLALLWWIERSALGVLAGKLLVLFAVAGWLTRWYRRWAAAAPAAGPLRLAPSLAGLAFGLPMMCNELSSLLFGFADRILLRWLGGSLHDVGVYTIGYGLAMAVGTLVGATLNQAFTPTAVRLFGTGGAPAVVALKRRMLEPWALAVGAGCALLLGAGEDLLVLLAGRDKAASGPIFVIVATTLVVYSLLEVAQYGMLLQKRAGRFFLVSFTATVFNLLLNVPLILHYGPNGAAVATVASYALLAWLQYRLCPPELRYLPRARRLLLAAALPAGVLAVLHATGWFGAQAHWARIAVTAALVLPVALALAWRDPMLRGWLRPDAPLGDAA